MVTMKNRYLDFDPYGAWLGIKSHQRPLNPYELLNLVPLDGDRSRIRAALDRQLSVLEAKRSTADPEVWQAVRDELESAAAALLDIEQRAVVDAAIKRKTAAVAAAAKSADRSSQAPAAGGGAVICHHCQRENPPTARFCCGCGQGLWEPCPQCGGELSADQQFCGRCGANVRGILDEQTHQVQDRLAAAHQFVEEFRFDAALSALRGVAAMDNPKLEKWAAQALAEIEQVESLKREHLTAALAAKAEAVKHFEQHAYEWTIKLIENTPAPLRDEEAASLLTRAQFAVQELETLLAEIKDDVQQKRTWDLFRKIDRVLSIRPDHPQVLDLADKLRQRFIDAAGARLEEDRYEDATQMLLQIPTSLRNDLSRALLDKASELNALQADLRQSPYATSQALGLAERLIKFAPKNVEAAKLRRRLQERCASLPAEARLAKPTWAAVRDRSAVGPPVQWLGHFQRAATTNDKVTQTLRQHPGEFFVALGLALQGLDQAPIDISLMPPEKGSMLTRLATMPLLRRGAAAAWGIDLGTFALKALKLVKDASGQMKVDACEYILLEMPLAHPDAEKGRQEILAKVLADLASRADFKGCRVVAALPGQRVLGRFFELPPIPAKKLSSAVEYEARHMIPIDLDELCWAWAAQGPADDKQADQKPRRIMVIAARRVHVEERLIPFKSAGIAVDAMQSDALALHSACRFEQGRTSPAAQAALGLLDVGADESNFVVSMPDSIWFRSFPQGGDAFTAALVKQFQLTYDQAELLKRSPAKAHRYYQFREAIEPLLVQFVSEIDRSLASFRKLHGGVELERLDVLGGGCSLHGLLRQLLHKR